MLTNAQRGEYNEALVALDLRRRGYQVSETRNGSSYDLAVVDPSEPTKLIRVEVKSSCRNPRTGRLWHDSLWGRPEALAKRDVLAIVTPEEDVTYEPATVIVRPRDVFPPHGPGCQCAPKPAKRVTSPA
jgi:predicted AAA+ superfamily ATPase